MKINVQAIHDIQPQIEMRAQSTLIINAVMETHQMQSLFYKIWEYAGDDILQEWLNAEGKTIAEFEPSILELLPEDIEVEAKLVLRSMHIARQNKIGREPGEWTDEELIQGLKLMATAYRNCLLKPAK